MNEKKKKHLKILLVLVLILGSFLLVDRFPLAVLRQEVSRFGPWAPLAYLFLFLVLPAFFFPVPVLVMVAGIVFGLFWGTVYTVIGAFFNAFFMYYLGRFIGREQMDQLREKLPLGLSKKLASKNQKPLTAIFFILRLIPLVSYNLINYVAGLTNIRLPNYLITTMIGILPGTVAFINLGDKSLNVQSPEFIKAMIYLLVITAFSALLLYVYLKKTSAEEES